MLITSGDELQQLLPPAPPNGFTAFHSENYLDESFSSVYVVSLYIKKCL